MIRVETTPLDSADPAHCALFNACGDLAEHALNLVEAEEFDAAVFDAPEIELPAMPVINEEGRRIHAVRLERDPGTRSFRLVLLAEPAA